MIQFQCIILIYNNNQICMLFLFIMGVIYIHIFHHLIIYIYIYIYVCFYISLKINLANLLSRKRYGNIKKNDMDKIILNNRIKSYI